MEISTKWYNMLTDYGIRSLPEHAGQAICNAFIENNNLFNDILENQKRLLMTNYKVPEEVFEHERAVLNYVENEIVGQYGVYSSGELNTAFSYFPGFIQNLCFQVSERTGVSAYSTNMSMLTRILSLSVILSNIDETQTRNNEGMVSRVKDFKSKNKNGEYRSTNSRFIRAFNQQFPGFPEAFVDGLHDVWRDSYGVFDFSKYHIHIGRTKRHFLAAYENENIARTSNITTTVFTKHLSNSCMQYDRYDEEGWEEDARDSGRHCVEAYATEQSEFDGLDSKRYFEVMYVTDKEDPFDTDAQVYGRTVFCRKENGFPEFGPFYVTSNMVKQFMMQNVPTLVEELSNEEKEEFNKEFQKFLNETDHKNCYDYPNVWEGGILRAYNCIGYRYTVDDIKTLYADLSYISTVSPYLDIGRKSIIPVVNKKTKRVYLSVTNKIDEEHEGYDENTHYVVKDGFGFKISNLSDHRGINRINNIKFAEKCPCCGNDAFKFKRVDSQYGDRMCVSCFNNLYDTCQVSGLLYPKEELTKVNFFTIRNPSGAAYQDRWLQRHLGDKINLAEYNLPNLYSMIHHDCSYRNIAYYDAYVHNNINSEYLTHFGTINIGGETHNNMVVYNEYIGDSYFVTIEGKQYVCFDERVRFDFLSNKFVIQEEELDPHVIIIIDRDGNQVSVKVTKESFNYLFEKFTGRANVSEETYMVRAEDEFLSLLKSLNEKDEETLNENHAESEGEIA